MEEPDRLKIMKRAYELWEKAGMLQGSAEKFYHLAEQQLRNEEETSGLPDTLKFSEPKTNSSEGQ
jgi:hypothetical protein